MHCIDVALNTFAVAFNTLPLTKLYIRCMSAWLAESNLFASNWNLKFFA